MNTAYIPNERNDTPCEHERIRYNIATWDDICVNFDHLWDRYFIPPLWVQRQA